ncbi:hypothetical protein [Leptospira stimsonii]|uniref:hypothetical protein n=1 Tax=Leptospira stimsonii TaxID=2202203 RepID=UPI0014385359|nr:hypothetical protein [Leptospira stimsonii]
MKDNSIAEKFRARLYELHIKTRRKIESYFVGYVRPTNTDRKKLALRLYELP